MRNQYTYYKRNRGGVIKEAERPHRLGEVFKEVDFVMLSVMEKGDDRYQIWAGNAKKIPHALFFPGTAEGLSEAEKKFDEFYEKDMRILSDNIRREHGRISTKKPVGDRKPKAEPGLKQKIKNQNKLRGNISQLIEKGQIDLDSIKRMYDEELARIEEKNKTN